MEFVKRTLKLIGFIIMISLASIGLGFNAAVLPTFKRDPHLIKIEQVDMKDDETEMNEEKT